MVNLLSDAAIGWEVLLSSMTLAAVCVTFISHFYFLTWDLTPHSIYLLNQYIYVQLYVAYQFGNLQARYSRSVSHSQSKLWPPSENLTNAGYSPADEYFYIVGKHIIEAEYVNV